MSESNISAEYAGIEQKAKDTILTGRAKENPLLESFIDKRYAISADLALPTELEVTRFLNESAASLAKKVTGFIPTSPDYLHITVSELVLINKPRKDNNIKSEDVKRYYNSLRDNLPDTDPINLELERIMVSTDSEGHITLVAAFISPDRSMLRLRENIKQAFEQGGREIPGSRDVIFTSLGRFSSPPGKNIIRLVNKINKNFLEDRKFSIDKLDIVSTTPMNVVLPKGYVHLEPPIELKKEKRKLGEPIFQRPSQRQKSEL